MEMRNQSKKDEEVLKPGKMSKDVKDYCKNYYENTLMVPKKHFTCGIAVFTMNC